jgi:hypothetical protein
MGSGYPGGLFPGQYSQGGVAGQEFFVSQALLTTTSLGDWRTTSDGLLRETSDGLMRETTAGDLRTTSEGTRRT